MKDFFLKKVNVEVLRDIRKLPDPTTTKDLSISVNRSRTQVYKKVNALEEWGLVEKQQEANGQKPLKLTDEGTTLAREFERVYRVLDEAENKPVKSGKEGDTE